MRLTIHPAGADGIVMKIEGKLAGPQVQEVQRAWLELTPSITEKRLLVDLRGVTHVDGSGRELLAHIHAKTAAEFLADTPLTKYFAEQARQSAGMISGLDK